MNLTMDDAEEVYVKEKKRRQVGKFIHHTHRCNVQHTLISAILICIHLHNALRSIYMVMYEYSLGAIFLLFYLFTSLSLSISPPVAGRILLRGDNITLIMQAK